MPFGGEPSRADLDALDRVLAGAHAVRVREMRGGSTVLLDERDPIAVRALREALEVTALPGFVCMCWGDVTLDFHDAGDTPLTSVTLHHGYSLRWDGWPEDAVLADGVRSLEWLAVRGVSEPLREFRAAERRQAEHDRVTRLWVREIPGPLAVFTHLFLDTSKSGGGLGGADLEEVRAALIAAYPDPVVRILALFTWHAAGTGAYSGHPVHERVPGQLLDWENRLDFAQAVELADSRAAAGAVRYLVNWNTRKRVGALLGALSPVARRKILDHARDDETRRWLARRITGLR
ncbi:hypothetical protein JK358_16230 [Nocardia sp. 2]|uniref:Uncharacterized protein n=1 Tax=Nocardia acididurans TaxID=2802282 RepID=A0ABS1M5W6_9NOCA|nr:hypothetical protein [Nocardia acididurans]MBL1075946.1 hypothetical protein [Nocardia acididurans]